MPGTAGKRTALCAGRGREARLAGAADAAGRPPGLTHGGSVSRNLLVQ